MQVMETEIESFTPKSRLKGETRLWFPAGFTILSVILKFIKLQQNKMTQQALEETPQDKRNGAIYLIKRVIYEQICRLDPSQSL
jgi:hypothetical protein